MQKLFRLSLIMISALFFFFIACTKTSVDRLVEEQQGNGGGICDTANMKYSTDVVPILQAHCYTCHGNGNTGGSGGINLDGYNNLKPWVDNGYFLGNLRHDPGYVGMPYQMAKLDTCTIAKLEDWVNQGAPDN